MMLFMKFQCTPSRDQERRLLDARNLIGLALIAFASTASARNFSQTMTGSPPAPRNAKNNILLITDATTTAGVNGVFVVGNSHTGGGCWVDYNGDLLPDLFISNGGGLQHRMFRNNGDGTFADVSSLIPKPDISVEDSAVKFADIENDGDLDILIAVDSPVTVVVSQPVNPPEGGPNLLYVNQGNGTFIESAASAGLVHPLGRRTSDAGFADYDNDGIIDVYLVSWTPYGLPLGVQDDYDRLMKGNGDGTFTDVTATFGTDGYGLDGLAMLWIDSDFDLFPDIYVANTAFTNSPPLFIPIDAFYRNSGGTTFTDWIPTSGGVGDDSWGSMGVDIGDIENDGDWDLYITDVYFNPPLPLGNPLYLGNPDGSFQDNSANLAGVQAVNSWPCNYFDMNLDGYVDIWVGTSQAANDDLVYLNLRDGTFKEETFPQFTGNNSQGGSSADYDGDGDIDWFIVPDSQDAKLYRNDSSTPNNWLEFKLYGTDTNHAAIGTVVRVTSGGMTQMRRVSGGDSAHSQSDLILHFGVGTADTVSVTISWPSGTVQAFPAVGTNDLVLIDEDAGILPECLTDGGSGYDPASGKLVLRLRSTYGGRTSLTLDDGTTLRYDSERMLHIGSVQVTAETLASVNVRTARGKTFAMRDVLALGAAKASTVH
ncbi:MAG: hypothetical protein ACI8PQ_002444 [Planctomycetota bacterium]|jgi:hypothetical protein